MKRGRLVLALSILTLVIVSLGGHVAAKRTTFKQQILPIDCQFQIVANGLGTVVYLTPKECGQVPPAHGGSSGDHGHAGGNNNGSHGSTGSSNANENGEVYVPTSPTPSGANNSGTPPLAVTPGPHIIKLNTKVKAYAKTGYSAALSLGSSVSYLPRGQNSGNQHTLTITNITGNGATVLLQPSGQFVEIPIGRTIYLDFDNNGNPALAVRITTNPANGHVVLRMRLLEAQSDSMIQPQRLNPLMQVLAVVLIAFTLITLSNVFWKRWLEKRSDQ